MAAESPVHDASASLERVGQFFSASLGNAFEIPDCEKVSDAYTQIIQSKSGLFCSSQ